MLDSGQLLKKAKSAKLRNFGLIMRYRMRYMRNKNGFTLAELLIALAITGILLVAVAAAFNASVTNYRENENIFRTINNARQALYRMTADIRTGQSFKLDDPNTKCTFTASGQDITYEYKSSDAKVYLITNSDHKEYVLCDNVAALNFVKMLTSNGLDVKSVQISMTVVCGNVRQTLPAAAVVRRNLN